MAAKDIERLGGTVELVDVGTQKVGVVQQTSPTSLRSSPLSSHPSCLQGSSSRCPPSSWALWARTRPRRRSASTATWTSSRPAWRTAGTRSPSRWWRETVTWLLILQV